MEDRLKTILYNSISLLIDETFEQYDDEAEWFEMLQNELGCTKEELEQYGIYITVDGGLGKNFIEMKQTQSLSKGGQKNKYLAAYFITRRNELCMIL